MKPYYEDDLITLYHADCLAVMHTLPDSSVDAIVTDPPYGLSNTKPAQVADVLKAWVTGEDNVVPEGKGFMGAAWDGFVPPPAVWKECLRVLKPGGHMAVFAGARTQDLMGLSIRLAGFEIRDALGWITGSGFPKSMDISKAIDKGQALGKNRAYEFTEWMRSTGITVKQISEATGTATMGGHYLDTSSQPAIATADLFDKLRPLLPEVPERIERLVAERTGIEWTDYIKREVVGAGTSGKTYGMGGLRDIETSTGSFDLTTPASDAAQQWDGWGTALKPAIEPIILARKSLVGTVAGNVLAYGVGGLNIDASRVQTDDDTQRVSNAGTNGDGWRMGKSYHINGGSPAGRFPANVLLDEHAAAEMDKQSGVLPTSYRETRKAEKVGVFGWKSGATLGHADSGGASRFFPVFKYQAKAPRRERPVIEREDGTKIQHPTVKPVALMEWLVTLITPPGGVVLDPFAGSGTTLQAARDNGFNAIGVEQSADFVELIQHRLGAGQTTLTVDDVVNDGGVPDECESPTIANTGNQALKEKL